MAFVSKLKIAREIFNKFFPDISKDIYISELVKELGIPYNSAQSYFYKFIKEAGVHVKTITKKTKKVTSKAVEKVAATTEPLVEKTEKSLNTVVKKSRKQVVAVDIDLVNGVPDSEVPEFLRNSWLKYR